MKKTPEILVTVGPLRGRRFAVTERGLRLGRSSTCEIAMPDPALSRNHCLFELRDGDLWVTDLASANGTVVNGVSLGADSRRLAVGDVVSAGDSSLVIVGAGEPAPAQRQPGAVGTADASALDLGLGEEREAEAAAPVPPKRILLWVAAVVAVVGAAALILSGGKDGADAEPAVQALAPERPVLHAFRFEKVEAGPKGIYRYALKLDAAGTLSVEIDDVPKENRHVRKSAALSTNALEELDRIFSAQDLSALDPEYTGVPLEAGTLKSFALTVVRGGRVFATAVENTQEPPAFRAVRERLETFSKNELGIWAIQFPAEKLVEMSAESRRAGDAKWEERDVQHGNLAAALAAYREAVFYLETVNPKPDDYGALVARRDEVARVLEARYRDQRFLADRAINLADWETARRELRILCELVPDVKDARHAEAAAKLLDVEGRLKKGGR